MFRFSAAAEAPSFSIGSTVLVYLDIHQAHAGVAWWVADRGHQYRICQLPPAHHVSALVAAVHMLWDGVYFRLVRRLLPPSTESRSAAVAMRAFTLSAFSDRRLNTPPLTRSRVGVLRV